MTKTTSTYIIRYDADLTCLLDTDGRENGYDSAAVLADYLDRVERLAVAEMDVDDVEVDRSQADCSGATRHSEILRSDGLSMSAHERDAIEDIERRALQAAIEAAADSAQ